MHFWELSLKQVHKMLARVVIPVRFQSGAAGMRIPEKG